MNQIPKIADDEQFKAIVEYPDYYISNYKRIYSMKSNAFIKDYITCRNHKKICIRPLYNKYFNQPKEDNLIALIKYGNHKFRDLYFDIIYDKFYYFKDGIYNEIEQHKRTNNKAKFVNVNDNEGIKTKISTSKIKKLI